MKKKIFKYVLETTDRQLVEMPIGCTILHVASVNDQICLWVRVNPEARKVVRIFYVFPTGREFDIDRATYVGTAVGHAVWHVYDAGIV